MASLRGKNKETNYRRYYRYHRYFKSNIPVYGPSLLTSHTASILETTWRHSFPDPFYVHACRSGKRAINNIYRSLGVPQRESVYVTSTLNTFLRYNGHRYISSSSTNHSRLTPLPKEPSRISLKYLIFLETRIIHLHFPADSLCLSSMIYFLVGTVTSRKTFLC